MDLKITAKPIAKDVVKKLIELSFYAGLGIGVSYGMLAMIILRYYGWI